MSIGDISSALIFLFFVLLAAFHFAGRQNRKNEEKLIRSRSSDTPGQFVESFSEDQREIASVLYGELQTLTHTKRVPSRRTDDLAVFNMDSDLERILKRIAKKFGYRLLKNPDVKLKTIQDCVEWIQGLPTK